MPDHGDPPAARPVALISQSGALAGVVLGWAARDGLGISKFVSYGNRADVNEVDLLDYLADDDETRVVGVYIETVSDGRGFMAAAAKCAARKPVIVIKAGRGESGQRATLSHTGSLAGSDAVYDTALRQCGAIRVESAEELFDLCRGFVGIPQGIRGRRVAIVTNSGGPSILAADRAEAVGLDVAEPGPAIRAKLASFLPPHAALKNPIDLTVEGTERGYREALTALLAQDEAKAEAEAESRPTLTLALTSTSASTPLSPSTSPRPIWTRYHSRAASATRPRPRANRCRQLPARGRHRGRGRLSPGPRRAQLPYAGAGSGGGGADGGVWQQISESANQRMAANQRASESIAIRSFAHSPFLEPDAMAWLGENGIATPPFRFAAGADEAVAACAEIGFPVVMKVVSPDILHKCEHGGVIVGIRDEAAARAAFETIRERAAGVDFRGVVIYPLIRGNQEVLVGISRDPQFGPVIAFGLGGIYTEVLHDVALRVAPIERIEADAMIRSIRAFPILAGARGQQPCDLAALAELVAQVSELPFRYPEIAELDLNPVFAGPEGAVAGDVRIIAQTRP